MDGYAGAAHRTTGMPDESNENRPTGSGATTKDNGTPWLHLITLKNRYKARTMENANLIDGAPVRRLGKNELGPHANEARMPFWLRRQLQTSGRTSGSDLRNSQPIKIECLANQASRIINVLAQVCDQDTSIERAYLCHPAVQYVSKARWEGPNFCGYRNMQMLVSYLQGSGANGCQYFADGLPSILRLQDLIEAAWDKGINSDGRVETGGIKGTRKHIGTPEAQAMFRGLGINCKGGVYRDIEGGSPAWESLLAAVESYFRGSSGSAADSINSIKVHKTELPPIYLQRPRHSLTIVGFEIRTDGSRNLLVFDPAFRPSNTMNDAVKRDGRGTVSDDKSLGRLLRPYRHGQQQLQSHSGFETLSLTAPHQPVPQTLIS